MWKKNLVPTLQPKFKVQRTVSQNNKCYNEHLELAYEKDEFDGLYYMYILSEKDSMGKTRVTKSKNVIQKLVNHFHKLHN